MGFSPLARELGETAGRLYRADGFYCTEAVLKVIRDRFAPWADDYIIRMSSGFPVGVGYAGCMCGALAGGIMALGLLLGRDQPGDRKIDQIQARARELHDWFISRFGSTCCRVLTGGQPDNSANNARCHRFTADVTARVCDVLLLEIADN
ncbi:MAG: C-GCAxxG-C-C family protein [Negativicutes bacterium]|nr:C-GCAxxG-C-C family protein [Negativicutes bacterium]